MVDALDARNKQIKELEHDKKKSWAGEAKGGQLLSSEVKCFINKNSVIAPILQQQIHEIQQIIIARKPFASVLMSHYSSHEQIGERKKDIDEREGGRKVPEKNS